MALIVSHVIPGGYTMTGLYLVANDLSVDKVTGVVTGRKTMYASEQARRDHEAAVASYHDAVSRFLDARAALGALKPVAGDTDEDIRQKEIDSVDARAADKAAQESVRQAEEKMGQHAAVIDMDFGFDRAVARGAGIVKNGRVDVSAVYDWLKSEYPDAEDA